VRHAYFTGAEEPYDKLKRALRAEIDEAAWSALYSTISRPFDPPKTGGIVWAVGNRPRSNGGLALATGCASIRS
jgi:adenine-specific DNA-methyltransferase